MLRAFRRECAANRPLQPKGPFLPLPFTDLSLPFPVPVTDLSLPFLCLSLTILRISVARGFGLVD